MKRKIWLFFLTIISIPLIFIISCEEDEPEEQNAAPLPFFNPSVTYGSMKDQDGNTYKTVTIGTQIWMAENLRVKHFANGKAIQLVSSDSNWDTLGGGIKAYCWYHDSATYANTYGAFYTFSAAVNGVCPTGWHLPEWGEWATLINYMGGPDVAGGKLKETDTIHWQSPNTGATNESGFTALPGGNRSVSEGKFEDIGFKGFWWSSTVSYPPYPRVLYLGYHDSSVSHTDFIIGRFGLSVRCIKD